MFEIPSFYKKTLLASLIGVAVASLSCHVFAAPATITGTGTIALDDSFVTGEESGSKVADFGEDIGIVNKNTGPDTVISGGDQSWILKTAYSGSGQWAVFRNASNSDIVFTDFSGLRIFSESAKSLFGVNSGNTGTYRFGTAEKAIDSLLISIVSGGVVNGDFYARDLTIRSQTGHTVSGNVSVHRIGDGSQQNTVLESIAASAILTTGDVTIEGGDLTTIGIVQANANGHISLDVNNYTAKTNEHETTGISLIRANQGASVMIRANDITINPDGQDGWGGVSAFGGTVDILADNISINGNIYSGAVEDRLDPAKGDQKDGSTVNIRLTDSVAGTLVVKGDVVTYNDSGTQNQVSMTLDNASSSLEGAVKNVDMAGNQVALSGDAGTSLNLSGGAVWTVTGDSTVKAVNTGGAIINTGTHKTDIKALTNSGTLELNTSASQAGQITVNELNNTGTVNLNLDSTAANDLTGKTAAEVAQNAANVLAVTTRNGDGQYNVAVAESSGVTGAITAKTDENGNIITSSVTEKTNTVMSSLMNISANNFLVFRSQMNDLDKRMGDLRTLPQADGIWARAIAGQSEYKQIHNTYQTLQIGADKRIGNLLIGATASYTDGDGTLNNGSSDDKNYTFGLYGSWLGDDGQFVDVIVKRHRLESEYDLAYTSGDRAKGSMDTSGTSLSVEYGWRLGIADTDFYIEPQAEFMYGHLNSVGYTTSNGVRISQDAIKTAVGRLGIAAGWVSPDKTGSAYIKASVLNDWDGDAKISATKGRTVTLHEDMGGTWAEFALGGTWNINKNFAAYGEVETTAGNPVRTTYQVSGGIRYSF